MLCCWLYSPGTNFLPLRAFPSFPFIYYYYFLVSGYGTLHMSEADFKLELKKPSHLKSHGDSTRARRLGARGDNSKVPGLALDVCGRTLLLRTIIPGLLAPKDLEPLVDLFYF